MSTDIQARRKKRQRTVVAAGLLFAFFMFVLVAGMLLKNLRRSDERMLEEGRNRLKNASEIKDNRERMQLSHDAKDKLRQYVDGRGSQEATGKLLLATAIYVEGRLDSSAGPKFSQDSAALIEQADLSECATADLLLASLLFAQSGSLVQANEIVQVALKRDEQRDESLRLAIDILHDLSRERETLELCDQLSELKPDDFHAWEVRARIHENQGYPERVVDDYQKIVELFPARSAPYRLKLVERLIEVGDRAGAKKQFEILEKQAPELLAQQPIVRAKMKHFEGEADQASQILVEILKNNPKQPDALLLQGRIQLAKNELDEAIRNLENLLELRPTDTQGHYLLGQAFARKGEKEKADAHFAVHKLVLGTRVKLHSLERQAAANPGNVDLPEQIAQLYEQIDATKHAEYWRGIANQIRSAAN